MTQLYERGVRQEVMPSARYTTQASGESFGRGNALLVMRAGNNVMQGASNISNALYRKEEKKKREAEIEKNKQEAESRRLQAKAERQQKKADWAIANEASSKFKSLVRRREKEIRLSHGSNALNIYEPYEKEIGELKDKFTGSMNENQRLYFEDKVGYTLDTSYNNVSLHETKETNFYHESSLAADLNEDITSLSGTVQLENTDKFLEDITLSAGDLADAKGMGGNLKSTFIKGYVEKAHLTTIDTAIANNNFEYAESYLNKYQSELAPGKLAETQKKVYQYKVSSQVPALVKDVIENQFPNNIPAQKDAIDIIEDPMMREIARKEHSVQLARKQEELKLQEQGLYENTLSDALKSKDGTIPTTYEVDGKTRLIPQHIIDKAQNARDTLLENNPKSTAYYYDVKDLMSTGSVEAGKLEINPSNLTQTQYFELRDMQSKVRGSLSKGMTTGSSSTNWISPVKQIQTTVDATLGDNADDIVRNRIIEECVLRFESEQAGTVKARKAIIDEVILDYVPGEEDGSGVFDDDDITLGEARKLGKQSRFDPDNKIDDFTWNNEITANVRIDNSEYGVTLLDVHGRDITPTNLEEGTKWNTTINSFIKKDDRFSIYDKSGERILDMPLNAKYNKKRKMFIAKEVYNNNGYEEEKIMLYTLDGSSYEQRRQ